ncbi:response regulator transcription factor [Paenibacillus sp. FSL K6-0276]|uniref:response regulator transcription factor n=1 Tax=Paenibacillus sp. FSL K6-0276 TaxID=2921450 RepID=UPI0030ED7588
MDQKNILIVDDHPEIREILRVLLRSGGYHVIEAVNGTEALELLNQSIDLVILDIMMPGISGLKTCEKIREDYNVPILFLTAKTQDSDKSMGLLMGGDDYLAKPFSHSELTARVKALLRRYHEYKGKDTVERDHYLRIADMQINKDFNEVFLNGEEINLTEIEYQILRLMVSYPRKIFSTQMLYESVWNEPYFYTSNGTVMVHIRKLRLKLEDDPQNPKRIVTVWGKGYHIG